MQERRKPAQLVTPESEDAGIFKGQIVQVVVHLVPMVGQNARQDVLIKGFIDGKGAIDVVFPGRRKTQTRPLVARLQAMLAQARKASDPDSAPTDVNLIRYPVRIEGGWRSSFSRDDQGWETRQHQLYAARWMMQDHNGQAVTFGESPKLS